ncbi:hypothetical protein CONLIGDRAFT_658082 [Coniochaeta ligniaria NRRL 30616]|uniref:DUF202 domain-containing protein n=1 Tax=Coniochaeta ligniaria NRRL 30616 TaxID=1408157 RepID=A0A1J7ING2_9PEZI|nr:hypothetical protein CONLIGDRAFT_658082 [Coniochaeta ligniaria NRRL 30616]
MAIWSRLKTPLYQNTGSVARDHLASERTFLAWIRSGMGFVTLGIAIDRFSRFEALQAASPQPVNDADTGKKADRAGNADPQRDTQLLVGCLMALGSGSIFYGTARHFLTMRALEKGRFRPSYYGSSALGAATAALTAVISYGVQTRRS